MGNAGSKYWGSTSNCVCAIVCISTHCQVHLGSYAVKHCARATVCMCVYPVCMCVYVVCIYVCVCITVLVCMCVMCECILCYILKHHNIRTSTCRRGQQDTKTHRQRSSIIAKSVKEACS